MKRINFTLLFGLLAIVQVFPQKTYKTNFEVQYNVVSHLDSLNLKDETNETAFLYTGSNSGVYLSYFKAKEKGLLESEVRQKLGLDTKKYRVHSINPSLNKAIYKNHQTGKAITEQKILLEKKYQFKEPKTPEWKVRDSAKTMQGYSVQKAIAHFAGRDYVAWFTVEIPIPDGPYLFSGLPGLIVELYDTKKDYHFVLNSVQKLKTSKGFQLPDVDTIKKDKFRKLYQIAQKNWPHNMIEKSFPPNPNPSEKTKKMIRNWRRDFKEMIESQNNPIELK